MHIALFPDLAIENWKSMNLYAQQLTTWLPMVVQDAQIRCADVAPSQWVDRFLPVPYVNRAFNDRFYSRYVVYARAAKAFQGDVNHVLDHSYGHLLRALDAHRTVVTVHDLYPLRLIRQPARTFRERARRWLLQWVMDSTLQARWLIVPSEFTKQELLRLTDYPAERISVVRMGVDETFFQPVPSDRQQHYRTSLNVPESATLLLHVGSCDERKNIPALLQAVYTLLQESEADLYLLQIGGQFTKRQTQQIRQLRLTDRIRQRAHVSIDELHCAYQAAQVVLLPSTYEGFGLTALEAMASGTPIVASRIGALREVVGETGILFDLDGPRSLTDAVMNVLHDPRRREQLRETSRQRAAQFTWEQTARGTWTVYHQAYSERA